MGLFSRKQIRMVDMHCHILPGIDDGSDNLECSLKMLHIAAKNGITDIIVTPHFKLGHHNASGARIEDLIDFLSKEMDKQGIKINLYPGNEIYFFSEVGEYLEREKVLSLNNTDRVLIEFSPTQDFLYIRNALDTVMGYGYVPVIAHVERYMCLLEDYKKIEELKYMGAEIQINASSVCGGFGAKIKKYVRKLIEDELVDYVGTDAHDTERRSPNVKKALKIISGICEKSYFEAITCDNALSLINVY